MESHQQPWEQRATNASARIRNPKQLPIPIPIPDSPPHPHRRPPPVRLPPAGHGPHPLPSPPLPSPHQMRKTRWMEGDRPSRPGQAQIRHGRQLLPRLGGRWSSSRFVFSSRSLFIPILPRLLSHVQFPLLHGARQCLTPVSSISVGSH